MSHAKERSSPPREDPMPSTSDFVKKLYKMLEDPSFQSVVCWGPHGDCFVVKDMNEFTKSILPRMFKHSNFASFVRQLNKYDFHKVKNTDDNQYGEHSWTFRHPDFHIDRRDALENIKRKVPAQRKAQQAAVVAAHAQAAALQSFPNFSSSALLPNPAVNVQAQSQMQMEQLQHEVRRLKDEGDDLRGRLRILERNYENVLVEMVGFQRGMAQQDGLMQSLISYFLGNETDKQKMLSLLNDPQATVQTLHRSPQLPQPQWQNQSQLQTPRELGSTVAQTQTQTSKGSLATPSLSTLLSPPQSRSLPQTSNGGVLDSSNPYASGNSGVTNTLNSASSTHYETLSMDSDTDTRMAWSGDPSSSVQISQVSPSVTSLTSAPGFSSRDGPRAEALSKIEDFYRARTPNSDTGNDKPQPWDDRRQDLPSPSSISSISQEWNTVNIGGNGDPPTNKHFASSSSSLPDENVQVYTLGKLVPRRDQASWSPTVDSSAVAGSSASLAPRPSAPTPRYEPSSASRNPGRSRSDQKRLRDSDEEGDSDEEEECVMPTPTTVLVNPSLSSSDKPSPGVLAPSASKNLPDSAEGKKIRVRRSAFVPSWAVPPRVLIVDDDIISRKLGGKFLQVSGCQFDMAVDGESAVNKMMNLEKYDLVLMDIMMPNLDGLAATSLIRQFDHRTPIISMTSNSQPSEIMAYYSSGMNDILTKPFTQIKLLEMLDKHLRHLTMRVMKDVPRSIGVPPMSDSQFDQALKSSANSSKSARSQSRPPPSSNGTQIQSLNQDPASAGSSSLFDSAPSAPPAYPSTLAPSLGSFIYGQEVIPSMDDENRINNPFSGMGIPDDQYTVMLQNVMNGNNFMNGIEGAPTSSANASVSLSSPASSSVSWPPVMGSLNGMVNASFAVTNMLGVNFRGEKRAYDSYTESGPSRSNGREKRSRFEVVE